MSQNDMIISDADGATVLADINSGLQALASTSKGNSRPSTPYAGQAWLDDNTPSTTVWTENIYDGSNDIVKGYVDTTNDVYLPGAIGAGTATLASNSTVDLGSTPETSITISGNTTITSFGSSMKPGQAKLVTFSGTPVITHNGTSLILPGGANITAAAGDQALVHCLSTGNYRLMYQRADGSALTGLSTKVGSFTRDTATASGSQAITGVGFRPKAVVFLASQGSTKEMSVGFSDASSNLCIFQQSTAGNFTTNSAAITLDESTGVSAYVGSISSFDSDGFTISWTRTGTPTGTATVYYMALR
jgi:hypothetical protein